MTLAKTSFNVDLPLAILKKFAFLIKNVNVTKIFRRQFDFLISELLKQSNSVQYFKSKRILDQTLMREGKRRINMTLPKSCRSQMFFKIGVLKNFAIFTGKPMCWSLFSLTGVIPFSLSGVKHCKEISLILCFQLL